MAASFSGRYAEAAKANEPVSKPTDINKGDKIPQTKVVSSKGINSKAAAAAACGEANQDDENPFLKDSPYYLANLKDKANDAKAEILVSYIYIHVIMLNF